MLNGISKRTLTGIITLLLIALAASTNVFTIALDSADIKTDIEDTENTETISVNDSIVKDEAVKREILKMLYQQMRGSSVNNVASLPESKQKSETAEKITVETAEATEQTKPTAPINTTTTEDMTNTTEIIEIIEIIETTKFNYFDGIVYTTEAAAYDTDTYEQNNDIGEIAIFVPTNRVEPVTEITEITQITTPAEYPTETGWVSLGEYKLTAYCPCVECCEIWSVEHPSRIGTDFVQRTASGTIAKSGRTIGVNPQVIPYGSEVIIQFSESGREHEYIAEDTGGALRRNKIIDIFVDTHEETLRFGVQRGEIFIKK